MRLHTLLDELFRDARAEMRLATLGGVAVVIPHEEPIEAGYHVDGEEEASDEEARRRA